MRILLVEDEPDAARMVAKGLREEAYAVDVVGDGESACYQASIADYDAIVLDVLLPRQDGLSVCRSLRREGQSVPILMLTARDAVEARIEGLDSGADDYLTKPFDFGELLARLRALVRRGARTVLPERLQIGTLELDTRVSLSIRARLTLWYTAVLSVVLAVSAAASYVVYARSRQAAVDEELLRADALVARLVTQELADGVP